MIHIIDANKYLIAPSNNIRIGINKKSDIFANGCCEPSSTLSSVYVDDTGLQDYSIFTDSKNQFSSEIDVNLNTIDLEQLPIKAPTWDSLCEDENSSPINQQMIDGFLPTHDGVSNFGLTVPAKMLPFSLMGIDDRLFPPSPSSSTKGEIQYKCQKKCKSFSELTEKGSNYIEINCPQTPVRKTTSSPNLIGSQESNNNLLDYCFDLNQELQIDGKYFSTPSSSYHHIPLSPPPTKPTSQLENGFRSGRNSSLSLIDESVFKNPTWFDSHEMIDCSEEQQRYQTNTLYKKPTYNETPITTARGQQPWLHVAACESAPTSSDIYNARTEPTSAILWDQTGSKKTLTLSSRFRGPEPSNKMDEWYLPNDCSYRNGGKFETSAGPNPDSMSTRDNLPTPLSLTAKNHHQKSSFSGSKLRYQREESPCVRVRKRKSERTIKVNTTQSNSSVTGFLNLTPNDSRKILAGVAPSGSNKTKARREKEEMKKRDQWTQSVLKEMQKAVATGIDPEIVAKRGTFPGS